MGGTARTIAPCTAMVLFVCPSGLQDEATEMAQQRILTGIRPTGPLHLGHYVGALENWLRLQGSYDCLFLIADYQVSDYADDIGRVRQSVWEVALDWLAVGLDPVQSAFVIESLIPE